MKNSFFSSSLCVLLLTGSMLVSCAKKVRFATSTVVPAAQGYAKIKKDDNQNYAIEVSINNLAEPKRLKPARSVYVVWIDTRNNGTKNLGQLVSSSGFFSGNLTASLKAVTPYKPTRVFITAEKRSNIDMPDAQGILFTKSF